MIIYFLRHGETEWNKKKILQGQKDSPLTLKGKKSAEKKGKILEKKRVDIIYTSDLGRCVQTAQIINRRLKLRMIKVKQLRERNFGDLNGRPNKEIKRMLDLNNSDEKAPNGESFNELKNRAVSFFKKLAVEKYSKVLLVIHDGTARAILSEYYNTNFNSHQCETSASAIYFLEAHGNKLKNLGIIK
ncbi:histidine phosphatase family protein [Patescibacteria group bacterium]|nr:histidine phosphatase family protein [Patescibacteria group bacterium]